MNGWYVPIALAGKTLYIMIMILYLRIVAIITRPGAYTFSRITLSLLSLQVLPS